MNKWIKRFLDLACIILAFSAFMDLLEWFLLGAFIPSWTISVMSLLWVGLIQVLKNVWLRSKDKNNDILAPKGSSE